MNMKLDRNSIVNDTLNNRLALTYVGKIVAKTIVFYYDKNYRCTGYKIYRKD